MKGASTDNRPASAMGRPGSEEEERESRQRELDRRTTMRMSKVAAMLDKTTHYVTDWTHPCLDRKGEQLSVSEYFPELKIAIDKFFHSENFDAGIVAFKEKELKAQGVRYFYLTPEKTLADLYVEMDL